MHNFKELRIWQKGRLLVKDIYILTEKLPVDEQYNMISQMRRAALSIVSNIAEGSGRGTDKDFSRFIDIATGSAFELESMIYVGFDLGYYSKEEMELNIEKIQVIQKMLYYFKNHINL